MLRFQQDSVDAASVCVCLCVCVCVRSCVRSCVCACVHPCVFVRAYPSMDFFTTFTHRTVTSIKKESSYNHIHIHTNTRMYNCIHV